MPRSGIFGTSMVRWALFPGILLALGLLSLELRRTLNLEWSVESLREFVSSFGVWGPSVYVGLLAFRFAVLVPSSILLVTSGICFGPLAGAVYATTGLAISAFIKYGVASVAGRDLLLRRFAENWRSHLSVGDRHSTAFALSLICAYPFGPKHIFQIGVILSGMSFRKYALAVTSGAVFRASLFAMLGESVVSGRGILAVSLVLIVAGVAPFIIPGARDRFFPTSKMA